MKWSIISQIPKIAISVVRYKHSKSPDNITTSITLATIDIIIDILFKNFTQLIFLNIKNVKEYEIVIFIIQTNNLKTKWISADLYPVINENNVPRTMLTTAEHAGIAK